MGKPDAQVIFWWAVELHVPETWDAFLEAVCPDSVDRRYIKRLLEAHVRYDPLLDGIPDIGFGAIGDSSKERNAGIPITNVLRKALYESTFPTASCGIQCRACWFTLLRGDRSC